jgi:tryptophan synthase alpha chain
VKLEMIGRYAFRFGELKELGHKAFIPFTVLGWPNPEACLSQVSMMLRAGVSALELGFPFSDPIADGPVIQKAAHETLQSGMKIDDVFALLERIRGLSPNIPIGVLVYYNMVLAHGVGTFFKRCADVGVDGVLIADLPVESADEVLPAAQENGIELIYLISPVTTPARIEKICRSAGGFLYLVSRLGVTGTSERDSGADARLAEVIETVRKKTSIPICAGFGISTPQHAESMLSLNVDGVITGSRVIEIVASSKNAEADLFDFCRQMVDVCTKFGAACS